MEKVHKPAKKSRIVIIVVICLAILAVAAFLGVKFLPKYVFTNTVAQWKSLEVNTELKPGEKIAEAFSPADDNPGQPTAVVDTDPSKMGIISELNFNGENVESYNRPQQFNFGTGDEYSGIDGICTFRGSNFRQGATYGTADIQQKKLELIWSVDSGSLPKGYGEGNWTGSGWTGQPLIAKWPQDIVSKMNINNEKKGKVGLTEVIYATMDGSVYFLDIDDGKKTRDNIVINTPFKGAGALDPRGYPLLYLGSGDSVPAHDGKPEEKQAFFIYSLIDGEQLYSFGKNRDPYAPRDWHAYDSSALVDTGSDTLIVPAENGILYTLKLNSKFDANAGKISIDPSDMVKMRYTTQRSREGLANDTYWLGMEDSCNIWKNWLYVSDNCGTLMCIDTNTMKVVWAQDILDDSNGSPIFELEDGHPYLYTSTSLHWTKNDEDRGDIPVWKIDGITGEIVWMKYYNCFTVAGVSGGVEASGLLGKNDLKNLVIYPIARTMSEDDGLIVAFDKHSGQEVWKWQMPNYSWSSPVAVYDRDGKGYIIVCDNKGNMTLLDGLTGRPIDQLFLGANIESSPAVYGNKIIVGTRGQKICGVEIR